VAAAPYLPLGARRNGPVRAFCARTGEVCVAGKDAFTSIYTAGDFLGRHSQERSGTPAQSRNA
jgi:hypothetical protein